MPTLANWQFSIGDLVGGAGTGYEVDEDGIAGLDLPSLRTSDVNRAVDHGERMGRDLLEGRTFSWTVHVIADSDTEMASLLESLGAVTSPGTTEVEFSYKLPGQTQRSIYARPRRRTMAENRRGRLAHVAQVALQFHATDPRIYSVTPTTTTVQVAFSTSGGGGTGGASWPWSWPLSWASDVEEAPPPTGNSGSTVVENIGTFETPWLGRFDAGSNFLTGPRIENLTTGDALDFTSLVLQPGQYLTIDSHERTAYLNGVQSRYGTLSSTSRWFSLEPGSNSIRATARSASSGSTFRITHRSAWV